MALNVHNIVAKQFGEKVQDTLVAAATIKCGYLVEITSAGKVQAHSTADGNVAPVKVAVEDDLQGNGVDDDYSSDDQVQVWTLRTGDQFYGLLADDESVNEGDFLESAGDGTLQKWTADTGSVESIGGGTQETAQEKGLSIVGVARESLDLTTSSGKESSGITGDTHILVEVR